MSSSAGLNKLDLSNCLGHYWYQCIVSVYSGCVYVSKQCSVMGMNMCSKTVEAVLVQAGCIVVLQTEYSSASRA